MKEFEDKINRITEQFMSLLDSKETADASIYKNVEKDTNVISDNAQSDFGHSVSFGGASAFCLKPDEIKIGGIPYENKENVTPIHYQAYAVKFDTAEQHDLNKELEKLYDTKHNVNKDVFAKKPTIAFSDSNIAGINRIGSTVQNEYNRIQTDSTLKKEVIDMSNNNEENVFYSFATIPQERALVEKKNWKDVLFMDIPWETKIDIWGGIKSLWNTKVEITF